VLFAFFPAKVKIIDLHTSGSLKSSWKSPQWLSKFRWYSILNDSRWDKALSKTCFFSAGSRPDIRSVISRWLFSTFVSISVDTLAHNFLPNSFSIWWYSFILYSDFSGLNGKLNSSTSTDRWQISSRNASDTFWSTSSTICRIFSFISSLTSDSSFLAFFSLSTNLSFATTCCVFSCCACSSSGYSCAHAAYGTVTLYESSWWPVGTQLEWE